MILRRSLGQSCFKDVQITWREAELWFPLFSAGKVSLYAQVKANLIAEERSSILARFPSHCYKKARIRDSRGHQRPTRQTGRTEPPWKGPGNKTHIETERAALAMETPKLKMTTGIVGKWCKWHPTCRRKLAWPHRSAPMHRAADAVLCGR